MIKKIFLLFFCINIFVCVPGIAKDAKSLNFNPIVAENVLKLYFEHMVTDPLLYDGKKFPIPPQWTDKLVFLNALRQWKYCLEENPDHSISTRCVADVLCSGAYSHILKKDREKSDVANNMTYYCDRYGKSLYETKPIWENENCDYNIHRIGYWQEDIRYEKKSDKSGFTHKGGTIAWRLNNPGNLRDGDGSRNACAWIETRQGQDKGNFAVYTSLEAGREAQTKLLKTGSYRNKTIYEAVKRYAPSKDKNNPVVYANNIKKALAAKWPDKKTYYETVRIKDLTDEEFEVMKQAMYDQESYVEGEAKCFDATGAVFDCPSNMK